ncbi:MAG: hypothetical protein ACHQ9S_02235 [Candidatus Binatia bacterium]
MKSWKKPTPEQVTKALALLGRAEHRRYFFDRLDNPEWIVLLRERGFFAAPPAPIQSSEDDSVRFPPWPQSRFLARVARDAPELVKEVTLAIPATDNIAVHEDIVDAALVMPAAIAAEIAAKEAAWLQEPGRQLTPFLLPEKLGALMSHLAKGGQHDIALQIARVVLAVLPDEKPISLPHPRGRMSDWDYQEILEKNLPDLVRIAPEPGLKLLCELLDVAVRSSFRKEAQHEPPEDISTAWRHAVEDSAQDLSPTLIQGVRGLLVTALRDAAERVVEARLLTLGGIVTMLENHRWRIFERLALHLLRLFAPSAPELVAERLADPARLADSRRFVLIHEFALLLREQFKHLVPEKREQIVAWIKAGPDPDYPKKLHQELYSETATDDYIEQYRKRWQLNRLALIRDDLSPDTRAHYDELATEIGEPDHPEFESYSSGVETGPTSPITAKELGSLSVEEAVARIARFHAEWKPSYSISAPTPEGLGRELAAAVTANPEPFAAQAQRFRDLHRTYVRGLISGLDQAARQNRRFDWAPVLELCRWVVEQPRAESEKLESGDALNLLDFDRDWTSARSAVAQLLSSAFETKESELPFELRETAWVVLEPLTNDPQPDEKYESQYVTQMGPAHLSINTIRGEALHAVVRYALWVLRCLKRLPNGQIIVAQGFGAMREVRDLLDAHLDTTTDPSLAIRSVYGRWFPWLHLLDPDWAVSKLPRIFPADETLRRYWAAAWNAYVIFTPAYDNIFEALQVEYARAVELIGNAEANVERLDSADRRLAEHLALMYGRGKIPLEAPSLVSRFFEKADDTLRAHLMETAGRILKQEKGSLPPEVTERLKRLWESRLTATEPSPTEHRAEVKAFSWWFLSGKFDEVWSLGQLRRALQLTGSIDPDFTVAGRLAEVAPNHPLLAIQCLRLMIEGDKEGFHVYHWRDNARKTLEAAKRSGDATALEMVDDIVNRLGARGFFEFRDLLS